jgi:type I restriction enzyme, S subunit
MSGYPLVPMGKFLRERREFITIDDMEAYKRAKVQWYGKGTILRDKVPGIEIKTKQQQVVRTNEFVVAEIDAKDGSFGVIPEELDGAIVSSHYFVYEIDQNLCFPSYLEWYVRTNNLQALVKAQGSTNYSAIRAYTVYDYEIPLPPLAEQRRIVAHIESLAARVNDAQCLHEEATKETEALLYSALNSVFTKSLYRCQPIGELCETTSGGTPSRARGDYFQGNIPWIKSGELEDSYIFRAEEHISEEALSSSSAKIFPKGTLVVALYGATVGKTGILEIDASTNQAVCALFPNDEIYRDYLWWFLRSKRPDYLKSSFGGAQPNISQKVIRETEIPVPTLDEQRHIVAYLDGLQAKVNALRELQSASGEELSALIPSILDKAFKGEL